MIDTYINAMFAVLLTLAVVAISFLLADLIRELVRGWR